MIKVAILGYGTVGSGVFEVINTNNEIISKKSGEELSVKYVLDLRDFPGDPAEKLVVHDINVILDDPEVSIICETMGGIKPAYDFTKSALSRGKSVCTSNKELVAAHAPELLKLAQENNCNYLFEASVGGGIPIIRPINDSLTSEKIDAITGILNGTTNFILTKMSKEGSDFAEVLKEAQDLGYAERNPEADVEGYDAGRKIAILSSLMYGKNVKFEDVYTEGITKISSADFAYAKQMNKSIKLLAMSKEINGECFALVAPFMIGTEYPLYSVNDVFNGVYVHGNMLGDTMYYGRGAGKLPTASAVVSDVVDCARHLNKNIMCFWEAADQKMSGIGNVEFAYFVRVAGDQEAFSKAQDLFGEITELHAPGILGEFGFVTKKMTEDQFNKLSAELPEMITRIRLEE